MKIKSTLTTKDATRAVSGMSISVLAFLVGTALPRNSLLSNFWALTILFFLFFLCILNFYLMRQMSNYLGKWRGGASQLSVIVPMASFSVGMYAPAFGFMVCVFNGLIFIVPKIKITLKQARFTRKIFPTINIKNCEGETE